MARLAGKSALITGGGTGIGAATARLMAREGARVAVAGRSPESLEAVVRQVKDSGGDALAVIADVQDETSVKAMTDRVADHFGGIDVLVANAALTGSFMARDKLVTTMDVEVWDKTLAVNLRGPMLCCKHVIPHMLSAGAGSIIFSGSGKGTQGDLGELAYGVSKAGLIQLMRSIATQFGKQGIRANLALIGLVQTDVMKGSFPQEAVKLVLEHHLTPYLGEPEHVAEAISFLASDAAAFITGAVVPVDGGVTAHSPLYADAMRMPSREGVGI